MEESAAINEILPKSCNSVWGLDLRTFYVNLESKQQCLHRMEFKGRREG